MALHIYAITDGVGDVSDLSGVLDETLQTVTVGSIVVIVGDGCEAVTATRERLAAQDRLVRALHARTHALLPVRFAATVPDVRALTKQVALKKARLTAALQNVRGCDQMTLWLLKKGAEQARDADGPGAEIQTLAQALRPFVHDERMQAGKTAGVLASLCHLIERTSGPAYRRAVVQVAPQLPGVAIRVSGPSPAYAFTTAASV